MKKRMLTGLLLAFTSVGILPGAGTSPGAQVNDPRAVGSSTVSQLAQRPDAVRPDAVVLEYDGRISRIYGRDLARGETAQASAARFLAENVQMLGVRSNQLMEQGPFPDGRHIQRDHVRSRDGFA